MLRNAISASALSMSLLIFGCEITTYRCPSDDWEWEEQIDWEWDDSDEDGDSGASSDCPMLDGEDGVSPIPGNICGEGDDVLLETPPCPDGDCGCSEDGDCDEGLLCIEARCLDPLMICVFDLECGTSGACINNECHLQCCDLDECPVGQSCVDGLCLVFELSGPDACVIGDDCGDSNEFQCVNATCHPLCMENEDCSGLGETCISGICRADTAPIRECASDEDCETDLTCRHGLCRLPCVADINCQAPTGVCSENGLCVSESELEPTCSREEDCSDGADCRDGQCE